MLRRTVGLESGRDFRSGVRTASGGICPRAIAASCWTVGSGSVRRSSRAGMAIVRLRWPRALAALLRTVGAGSWRAWTRIGVMASLPMSESAVVMLSRTLAIGSSIAVMRSARMVSLPSLPRAIAAFWRTIGAGVLEGGKQGVDHHLLELWVLNHWVLWLLSAIELAARGNDSVRRWCMRLEAIWVGEFG
jgi:hypothetical protein